MKYLAENIFLVESPLQVLNAVEAKNYFKLSNCHLIIHVGHTGFKTEMLNRIAMEGNWDKIHYLIFRNDSMELEPSFLSSNLFYKIRSCHYDYIKYCNKKLINELANLYGETINIFLGNYLGGHQEYMRHFANNVIHKNLYLLDDGTDALLIAKERKSLQTTISKPVGTRKCLVKIKSALHDAFIELNTSAAEKITFFSAYDLETTGPDCLIRNDYRYLRSRTPVLTLSNDIYFLGQCLVEDNSVDAEFYLDALITVKKYFKHDDIVYIPHPRESQEMISRIRKLSGYNVKRLDAPIEFEVSIGGRAPKVLAGFFTSALQNSLLILGKQVSIKSFYLPPECLKGYENLSTDVYDYFGSIKGQNIELVKL